MSYLETKSTTDILSGTFKEDKMFQRKAIISCPKDKTCTGCNCLKDAKRWEWAIKPNRYGALNMNIVYEFWDGKGSFVDAIDRAMEAQKENIYTPIVTHTNTFPIYTTIP